MHGASGILVDSNCVDGVLMNGLELRVGLRLSLQVHLTEHVQGRLFAYTAGASSCLVLNSALQLPTIFISTKAKWLAVLRHRVRVIVDLG